MGRKKGKISDETIQMVKSANREKRRKKKRKIRVIFLLIVLGSCVLVWWYTYTKINKAIAEAKAKLGSKTVVVCKECTLAEERRIQKLSDYTCSNCSGKLGYAMQCQKCKKIFPKDTSAIITNDRDEYLKQFAIKDQCPSCGSTRTKRIYKLPKDDSN